MRNQYRVHTVAEGPYEYVSVLRPITTNKRHETRADKYELGPGLDVYLSAKGRVQVIEWAQAAFLGLIAQRITRFVQIKDKRELESLTEKERELLKKKIIEVGFCPAVSLARGAR